MSKTTELKLKALPEDVRKFILAQQGIIKSEKGLGQFSMELTIYKIIRDHEKILKEKK